MVVLTLENMEVTIKPAGKHKSLSWVADCAVTVENMVYKAYVVHHNEQPQSPPAASITISSLNHHQQLQSPSAASITISSLSKIDIYCYYLLGQLLFSGILYSDEAILLIIVD